MSTLKQELAKFIALEGKYELFLQSNNCEANSTLITHQCEDKVLKIHFRS